MTLQKVKVIIYVVTIHSGYPLTFFMFVNLENVYHSCITSGIISPRPALRKTRNSLRLDREVKFNIKDATPPVAPFTTKGNLNELEADTLLYYSEEMIHL